MFDFFIKKLGKLKSRNYNSGMDFTKQTNKNSALVMEGGGMRGLFTCGVIDVFMENGIDFDMAVGVSAGVTFGCNIKSKQIGRPLRYTKKYRNDKRYSSIHSLVTTGDLFNVEFCYHTIPEELDIFDTKTFAENPMKFYCVATNCLTGKARVVRCRPFKYPDSSINSLSIDVKSVNGMRFSVLHLLKLCGRRTAPSLPHWNGPLAVEPD